MEREGFQMNTIITSSAIRACRPRSTRHRSNPAADAGVHSPHPDRTNGPGFFVRGKPMHATGRPPATAPGAGAENGFAASGTRKRTAQGGGGTRRAKRGGSEEVATHGVQKRGAKGAAVKSLQHGLRTEKGRQRKDAAGRKQKVVAAKSRQQQARKRGRQEKTQRRAQVAADAGSGERR